MLLLCILNQKVCSNEWCVMKAVESVAKWKSFCCQLAQSKHQNWADVVCITAEKFIFKFCFYDGRILFDMPLKPQSSHLSFLRTNQSCFCGDCWVCLLIRGLCRATNQHVMCAQYQYPINISFLTAKNKTKQLLGVWKIVENIMTSCKRCLLFFSFFAPFWGQNEEQQKHCLWQSQAFYQQNWAHTLPRVLHIDTHAYTDSKAQKWICLTLITLTAVVTAPPLRSVYWQQWL